MNLETSLLECRTTINQVLEPIGENKLAQNKTKVRKVVSGHSWKIPFEVGCCYEPYPHLTY